MNKKILQQIIANGESETVEFKTSFGKEVIETLSAFANTNGGSVIIGVTNRGELKGVKTGKETLQQWTNQIKLATSPAIIPDITAVTIKNKTLAILFIIEYPVKPVSCNGKYFRRIHNSNHQMNINEISNLHLQTYHSSWDHCEDTRHSLEVISLDKVNRFIEMANRIQPYAIADDPMTVLKKFELLQQEHITHGCHLLFMAGESLISFLIYPQQTNRFGV